MADHIRSDVTASDVAVRIDSSYIRLNRARDVDGGKHAGSEQKAVSCSVGRDIPSDNVAVLIDTDRQRVNSPGEIDYGHWLCYRGQRRDSQCQCDEEKNGA